MEIIKFNDYESVENAVKNDEPMMAVISFDGEKAYVSHFGRRCRTSYSIDESRLF